MGKSIRSSTPTMRMCRFMWLEEPTCYGPCRWMLETDGKAFAVCDTHLAEGIRKCGLPAQIKSQPLNLDEILVNFISGSNDA